jgi:hypothetical protein
MDIKAVEANYSIQVQSKKKIVSKLQTKIRRFEKKHAVSSQQMDADIREGITIETPEISLWMQNDHLLRCITSGTKTGTIGQTRLEQSGKLPAHL